MMWRGATIGAAIGAVMGRSWLGVFIYAAIGYSWERWWRECARLRREGARRANPFGGASTAVDSPYETLGARETDSDDMLRRKYRELAKKNHPDALRARGLSEPQIAAATERMSRINAAWALIRKERNI